MIGQTLSHYRITAKLGEGGMGEVYQAEDTKLGREVAIKVLPAEVASDPERLERFQREAKALAALDHPGIVGVYSVEEADGVHFLTMQLVKGQPLDELIPEQGLPTERIVEIGSALAAALAAAHEKDIVHRDLKPANVMVTSDGRVKVLDFGLAKIAGPRSDEPLSTEMATALQTRAGMVMGTVPYMSPEQISGREVDHRSDIYSLGVLLYEMATGQRPFRSDSTAELMSAILRDSPEVVTNLRADLPVELEAVIEGCLRKDPHDRLSSARDVCEGLRGGNVEMPAIQAPVTPASRPATATDSGAARSSEEFWVAVLPFKYSGTNTDLTALAEGLSEEIVTGLSRFSYLRVIARSSTERYSGEAVDVRSVGTELGARYVMEGSLRQAGPTLRVAVQIVDAVSGAHLWAETYDRPFSPEETFALQDELVPRIVSTVADWYGVLPHSMSEAVRVKPPGDLSSYEAVLRSFGYFERISPEEHAAVRGGLERAVEHTPGSADGWAMLSMMYGEEHRFEFNKQPDPLGRSLRAARSAVDAAHANHFAWLALAQALFFRREFPAFRDAAERAIELNPMDGSTLEYLGHLIAFSGDWERGCHVGEQARLLNPNHPGWYWTLPFLDAYRQGDYEIARGYLAKCQMRGGGAQLFTNALHLAVCGQLGDGQAADQILDAVLSMEPDFAKSVRGYFEKWYLPELVEHLMEGLSEAGLNDANGAQSVEVPDDTGSPETASIAVLPFANMSGDEENQYFSDGLAEEILNGLTRLPGLRVIARTSAFRFREEQDLRKVGEALGVRSLLEGSVRKSGNRLRITAQLIDVADQSHLWSERFDRDLDDVFAIQDEISAAIVEKLHLSLGAGTQKAPPKVDVSAYEALLEARHFFFQFTPKAAERALVCLRRALSIEPDYPDALVLHAFHHVMTAYMFVDPREVLPEAQELAERALELDPNHGEAQAAVALLAVWMNREWENGERLFRRALELAPGSAQNHELYGLLCLLGTGRLVEALAELDRAVELDPLSALYAGNRGRVLTCSRRFSDAEESCRRGLDLDPGQLLVQVELMYALSFQEKFAEAEAIGRSAIETHGYGQAPLHALAVSLVTAGKRDEARQLLDDTKEAGSMAYQSPLTRGLVHAAFSEMDEAVTHVEQAIEQRDPMLWYLKVHPMFDTLRTDPRFPDLLQRLNLLS